MKTVVKEAQNGLKFNIGVYETYDEADKVAGQVGAALHECNEHLIVHGALPLAWSKWIKKVTELTSVKPLTEKRKKTLKDGSEKEVEVQTETKGEYVARVIAMSKAGQCVAFDPQVVADELGVINVDIAEAVRESKPKKLPDDFATAAKRIIANGRFDFWADKIRTENKIEVKASTGNVEEDIQTLGWAIRERELQEKRARLVSFE